MIVEFARKKTQLGTRYHARMGNVVTGYGCMLTILVCNKTWGAQAIIFGRHFRLKHCNVDAVREQILSRGY